MALLPAKISLCEGIGRYREGEGNEEKNQTEVWRNLCDHRMDPENGL